MHNEKARFLDQWRNGRARAIFPNFALCLMCLLAAMLPTGCRQKQDAAQEVVAKFAKRKEAQARALNEKQSSRWPREATKFFKAAKAGNWTEVSNRYSEIQGKYGWSKIPRQTNAMDRFMMRSYALGSRTGIFPTNYWPDLRGPQWQPMKEVQAAVQAFQQWNPDLLMFFGTNLIQSIPTNSIYFGASDEGRFVVSALCSDQARGEPFFTLTQNALADPSYRHYVQQMYGQKIHVCTEADSQQAFFDYVSAAKKRAEEGKLKPGEKVSISKSGSVNISGRVAVMQINAAILRDMFQAETNHEFYIEEDEPLDWTYPYLVPHGLIFRINREPLARLDEGVVKADRDFWSGLVTRFTGLEIEDDTPMPGIIDFAKKCFLGKDLDTFKGDKRFVKDLKAQERFGKLRLAIAQLYAWRAQQPGDKAEQQRMAREAEVAFKQAFALDPRQEELSYYEEWLRVQQRTDEANLLNQQRGRF